MTRERHVHVDHVFPGRWAGDTQDPETRVRWFTEEELPATPGDTRLRAKDLFSRIGEIVSRR